MTPTTRAELARLVDPGGIVIELGVAAGKFACQMLSANPEIRYVGVDRWSDHHDGEEYGIAVARIDAVAKHHPAILRTTFAEAAKIVKYQADMIYIDGYAHTGQEGGQTLRDWWPKVKPGGIFAGHDYSSNYPQTIRAVDEFAEDHGLELNVIEEIPNSSWWVRKPLDESGGNG